MAFSAIMVIQVGFPIKCQSASTSGAGKSRNRSGGSVSDMKLPLMVLRERERVTLSRMGAVSC